MKNFLAGFIVFAVVFSIVPGAMAESPECEYDLIAGQHTDVGAIKVQRIGNSLNFNYETIPGWCISEVHLMALNESPNDTSSSWYTGKYVTKKGNPKVGQFEINEEGLCKREYSGTLDLTNISECPCDTLYIAAHAVVCECECECIFTGFGYKAIDEAEGWVINYSNYITGTKYGLPDDAWRYDPLSCLGEADTVDKISHTFTSLGQDGSIELYFNGSICGDGDNSTPDLEIYETTYNKGEYPDSTWVESISIEAFYNGSYYLVGTATNNEGDNSIDHTFINYIYDLPSGVCIEKIRINDTSTLSGKDYDIDAVKANYWCVPTYDYECICTGNCETAWGNGTSFPGNNWAMYFEYGGCICD
uniref:Uncharacterized protein n=1 Tax=Methanococcus maripaludis (strain C6 / ATCC BAA-1332) TaxID=444158 RepID=A9A7I8_METM6